jgi:Double zinc ribbon
MFCSQCGKPLTNADRFCGTCGAAVATKPRTDCPSCKAEIRPGVQFCHECGTALSVGAMTSHITRSAAMSADAAVAKATVLMDGVKRDTSSGQRISLGSATLALILFFLPWADVSCMGVGRTMSGYELASNGSTALWLVPLAMIAVLVIVYRVALAPQKTPDTAVAQKVLIAAGFVAGAAMLLTYLTALNQAKKDPIFGNMAEAMIKVRFTGVLALLASLGTSLGGFVHRNAREAAARGATDVEVATASTGPTGAAPRPE